MKEFETINYNSYRIGEDRITKTKLIEYEEASILYLLWYKEKLS